VGSNDCVAGGCKSFSIVELSAVSGFRCVEACPDGTYGDNQICRACHAECMYGCKNGGGAADCVPQPNAGGETRLSASVLGCMHVAQRFANNSVLCLPSCPHRSYTDGSGFCVTCNPVRANAPFHFPALLTPHINKANGGCTVGNMLGSVVWCHQ
jgi:hypothetical protein